MAVVSENPAVTPGAVSKAGASLRISLLRLSPLVLALVVEPWTAAAIAVDLFRRKPQVQGGEVGPSGSVRPRDSDERQQHVVTASVILLGLAAIIIGALAITSENARTWSDEIAWIAAGFMLGSIALLHTGRRGGIARPLRMRLADGVFLAGIAAILLSLFTAAWQLPR